MQERNDVESNLNLTNIVLFYLLKLLQSGEVTMTLEQLQADIKIVNGLLDAISHIFPNATENSIITFLEAADNNPIVQNIILLVVNAVAPASASAPVLHK